MSDSAKFGSIKIFKIKNKIKFLNPFYCSNKLLIITLMSYFNVFCLLLFYIWWIFLLLYDCDVSYFLEKINGINVFYSHYCVHLPTVSNVYFLVCCFRAVYQMVPRKFGTRGAAQTAHRMGGQGCNSRLHFCVRREWK